MLRNEYANDLPPLSAGYLIDYALDFGLKTDWTELAAWSDLIGVNLHSFECRAVIRAGVAYNNGVNEFSGKDAPRPYWDKTKGDTGARLGRMRNQHD